MGAVKRERQTAGSEYRVRTYRPGDRESFLDLYEAVWGRKKTPEWFEWRFGANPYSDGVEMIVAERDGEIVGVEPCLPFELKSGAELVTVLQPADWLVHPDHRRQGVFTGMTTALLDQYEESKYALYYNFPTDVLLPGLDKFDWHRVGEQSTYYRIQRPKPLVENKGVGNTTTALAVLAGPVSRIHRGIRDRLVFLPSDLDVDRYDGVPTETFTTLYGRSPPARLHISRDEAFYGWRFENPDWKTRAYVARDHGVPVAGVVTCEEETRGVTATRIVDVQPMEQESGRADAFATLLGAVVRDNRGVDVLTVAGSSLPDSVLSQWGFRRDDSFPLSRVARRTVHVVRPTSDVDVPSWRIGGQDPTNPDDWLLSLAGQDIA